MYKRTHRLVCAYPGVLSDTTYFSYDTTVCSVTIRPQIGTHSFSRSSRLVGLPGGTVANRRLFCADILDGSIWRRSVGGGARLGSLACILE
jgi:hypothetical protein